MASSSSPRSRRCVGGRVVKRDGRLLHHDVAELLESLAASARHVTAA